MANVPQSDSNISNEVANDSVEMSDDDIALTTDVGIKQVPASSSEAFDLNSPELYLNRELTWLAFNRRVLSMADDAETQLLERVKYLAIISNNIDEFQMKRIGGLKQQVEQLPDGQTSP